MKNFQAYCERAITHITGFAERNPWRVIAVCLALAVGLAYLCSERVKINTDTTDMLSKSLSWRIAHEKFKRAFPDFSDTIIVVVDAKTSDLALDTATELSTILRRQDALYDDVFFPQGNDFFRQHQFLYLDTEALESLVGELSEAQPFLARLSAHPTSVELFGLIGQALTTEVDGAGESIASASRHVADAIAALNVGDSAPMSWQQLLAGRDDTVATPRQILVVRPRLDFGELLPAAPAIKGIEQAIAQLPDIYAGNTTIRLTGSAALAYDEMQSVIAGSINAAGLALAMVLICLTVGLRSFSLVVATLLSLIIGLIYTASFAILGVGTLNMISVAFAVLYVGLGVDFAIHICLRYRELLSEATKQQAIGSASQHVGVSLVLCAITTAVGFFAFIPTAYRGVAELGLIAGVGMFISLAVSLLLLPALLHVLPRPRAAGAARALPQLLSSLPHQHAKPVMGVAAVVWVIASLSIPGAEFDSDPVNLNNQQAPSVLTYRDLISDDEHSPLAINALADTLTDIAPLRASLESLDEVRTTRALDDLIPAEQDEKLMIINDLALVIGDDLELNEPPAVNRAATRAAVHKLVRILKALNPQTETGIALAEGLESFLQRTKSMNDEDAQIAFDALEVKLLGSFAARIRSLGEGLDASAVDVDSLPEDMRRRWIGTTGDYRIEILPRGALKTRIDTERFVNSVSGLVGDRTSGSAIINLGASAAVRTSFIQAFSYALLVIGVLLYVIVRSGKEVSIVLSPLILAGLITVAVSVIFDMPFNFANIIALPLLLGIGVDSAVHILHRYKTDLANAGNLLQTSTARGVFFSTLTTTVSFGNLASSSHAGTASMGVMLTIGVITTLICTLIVLPAMLKLFMPVNP